MQMTGTDTSRRVIVLDDVLLRRALWVVAAVALAVLLFSVDRAILGSIAAGTIVGLAAMWYAENEIRRDFIVSIDTAWGASIRALAMNGLVYDMRRTRRGITEGSLTARDARVRLEVHPGGVTRVRVRVGWFALPDNRRREALVVEQIVRELDFRRTEAVTAT
jgi:hypothetical protein